MTQRLHAVYDGKVLCPEEPVDLELNERYLLTIERNEKVDDIFESENDPAFNLSSLAVRTGISDLATEHNHYLYGTQKQQ
ncbi:MAG: antitoxin family protein [Ignavibacteriales bacterium]|nr:antitoxin family protein [Ignavibacteriales bacterium]